MVVHTPRLCSDPAFQPPAESRSNTIECLEVMNDERIKEYKAEKERQEKNLNKLMDIVSRELEKGAGADILSGKKKPYVGKPTYRVKKGNKKQKLGEKGGRDDTFVITGEDGVEQMVMVQEVDVDDAMMNLPDGVQVVDMEAFARMARGNGQLPEEVQRHAEQLVRQREERLAGNRGEGAQAEAQAGAEGHDEL